MKDELRKHAKIIRTLISNKEELDLLIINRLKNVIKDCKVIGIYYPIRGEVDVLKLINLEQEFYLPCIEDDEFVYTKFETPLYKGKYGIHYSKGEIIDKNKINVIIVPSLYVNKSGYRIGYGAGYYDRMLEDYVGIKIFIVYDALLSEHMFQEAHDVRSDYIITEKETICLM